MKVKQLFPRLVLLSLALAWGFDLLFWGREPGISFPIFVTLCLAGGIVLTLAAGERPPLSSLILLVPVLFFAGFTTVRAEPFTRFISLALSLGGMVLLTMTWLGGSWARYRVADWVMNGLRMAGGVLFRPLAQLGSGEDQTSAGGAEPEAAGEPAQSVSAGKEQWRPLLSVGVGLLLALPVLAILGGLLSAADPIFGQEIKRFFDLERLDEYLFRLVYILVGAYLLVGIFLYALTGSREERVGDGSPPVPPFLGWVEAVTLLGAVNLLFAAFTAVQFRYFFGGQANIRLDGFTYAEYARQGFGELCAAAAFSLLLFLTLSAVTRRNTARSRRLFSALGVLLVLFVGVLLVSAFQRLTLYEAAYGFSRIRTYTHVFILVLAALLLATIGLEISGKLRYFALAAVVAVVTFGLSLGLLNVDRWIVRQNVARTLQGQELDGAYLTSLSEDATPALFARFDDPALPAQTHDLIGGVLACRAKLAEFVSEEEDWRSYHFSIAEARRLYQERSSDLSPYTLRSEDRGWVVSVNQEDIPCGWYD